MADNRAPFRLSEFVDQSIDLTRYDLVLAVIPTVFIVALMMGTLLSVSPRLALATASAVGGLAVADALFLNPPNARGG